MNAARTRSSRRAKRGTEAQDPAELFDVVDRDGAPLGFAKARALVHRDGDWHRSVHIWVWGRLGGAPHVVLQRRGLGKDTHPGAFDVAAAGHVRAGESLEDTLREAEEELGLCLGPSDVVLLGRRRRAGGSGPGLTDNEVQTISCTRAPVELGALVPNPAEVAALVAVPLDAAPALFRDGGEVVAVPVGRAALAAGARAPALGARGRGAVTVRAVDLVPAPDGYYALAVASVGAVVAGREPTPWELGPPAPSASDGPVG